ncbi:MAG: 5'-nucleotidase C-terminal domain-containing protein [Sphaerochaetaceae bacterium]
MKKRIILVVLLTLLIGVGCTTTTVMTEPMEVHKEEVAPPVEEPQEIKVEVPILTKNVVIIASGGIQGAIFPFDLVYGGERNSQMQLSSLLKQERAKGQPLFLVDLGDILAGEATLCYYKYVDTQRPHIVQQVMNALDYDVATVGRADLEGCQEGCIRLLNEASFPFLAANVYSKETNELVTAPYVIVEKEGIKVAFFAVVDPVERLSDLVYFEPFEESLAKWLPVIKEEAPDLLIGLYNGEEQVSGIEDFDLILTSKGGVTTVDKAVFTLAYDEQKGSYQKVGLERSLVSLANYSVDQDFFSLFKEDYAAVEQWLNSPIGKISESVSSRDSFFTDSKFVDLIHSIQLANSGAELSIAAPTAFDALLREGPVYVKDLFRIYPDEHYLVSVDMLGSEIKEYLELSYAQWFNQMKSLDDELIMGDNWREWDSLAGLNYVVDITKAPHERVIIKTLRSGAPFRLERTFSVVFNSARAFEKGGYLEQVGVDASRIKPVGDKTIRSYLMDLFQSTDEVEPSLDNNWLVIPNLWLQRGMKNSYPQIFPSE